MYIYIYTHRLLRRFRHSQHLWRHKNVSRIHCHGEATDKTHQIDPNWGRPSHRGGIPSTIAFER